MYVQSKEFPHSNASYSKGVPPIVSDFCSTQFVTIGSPLFSPFSASGWPSSMSSSLDILYVKLEPALQAATIIDININK